MQCLQLVSDGVYQAVSASSCTYYAASSSELTAASLFDPSWVVANGGSELLQTMFYLGLSSVLIPFLAALSFGMVIGFIRHH